MNIKLENAGKRFSSEWIFRGVNEEFAAGERYAILGSNGSGKSTLAQVIGGFLSLTEGKIHTGLESEALPLQVSFTSPYLDIPDEFTPGELSKFHFSMRACITGFSPGQFAELTGLSHTGNKHIKAFSSGMKQRVKLGLAIFTRSEVLIVDEPFTNLDTAGKQWFNEMLEKFLGNRTLFICSNHQPEEYQLCRELLEMKQWK
ncbi:MAG: ATP-binding cassette domain-containing protein [Bacteroidia bacterium]|nr:ATP-binding cassette domain-containing protein [Bacteroidia bacterium]